MDRSGHQDRLRRPTATSLPSSYGGGTKRSTPRTSRTRATRCSRPRPAACSCTRRASSPASARSRPPTAGTDYNFFPFPDINAQYAGAVEGAGDLFGMFHDTPAAKSLMAYLVTAPAQDIWVKIGGALSANKNATDYPDDISKRSRRPDRERQDLRVRRVRPDADRHERRVLVGHRRLTVGKDPTSSTRILHDAGQGRRRRLRRSRRRPTSTRTAGARSAPRPGPPTTRPREVGHGPRLITAVIVVVGVPAVLIGYIWADRAGPAARPRTASAAAPAVAVARARRWRSSASSSSTRRSAPSSAASRTSAGKASSASTTTSGSSAATTPCRALKNNVLWLVFLTLFTVGLGLLIAVLVDRVRYESVAKA